MSCHWKSLQFDIHCASCNSIQLSKRASKGWLQVTVPSQLDLNGRLWRHKTAQDSLQRAASTTPSPVLIPGHDVSQEHIARVSSARLSVLWLQLCYILGWLRCLQAALPALRMLSLMQRPWVRLAHLQSMQSLAQCFAF